MFSSLPILYPTSQKRSAERRSRPSRSASMVPAAMLAEPGGAALLPASCVGRVAGLVAGRNPLPASMVRWASVDAGPAAGLGTTRVGRGPQSVQPPDACVLAVYESIRGPATPFADTRRQTPTTLELMPPPCRPGGCRLGRALNQASAITGDCGRVGGHAPVANESPTLRSHLGEIVVGKWWAASDFSCADHTLPIVVSPYVSTAEGKGVEPSTGCPAPDFESGC